MNNDILFPTQFSDSLQQSTPVTSAFRGGSEDENKVTITGIFSRLPMEVTERILAALIPPHHCTQSSFDVHTCTVSYGPIVRAIANTNQSCKYFYVLSRTLRRIAHPVYRKEAAALEFSFKTRNRPEVKEDLFDDLSQKLRKAKYVRTVQSICRHRYDIDPVTDSSSELPQFAHTNRTLSLTSTEISAIKDQSEPVADNAGAELDQIILDKLWDAGKTHAVVLSEVETEALLNKFLSHYPQGLVALQLPKLLHTWNFKRLLQTLSLAMDLQHLAIQKCCEELFLTLFRLEKIESLKLVDAEFPTEAWSGLKTEEKIPLCSSLKSLSLKTKDMAHVRALFENLAVFPNLEEVRIICTAEDNSQFISVLDVETLLQATHQLRKLRSIELHSLAKGASSRFVTDLPESVQCLALPAAGLRAEEIATLASSLELKNSLQKLNLCGHYNVDTGKAFKRWLANPNCSLRYLELQGYWAKEAAFAFVQGLSGNRSLDTLIIKMTNPGGSDSTDGGETDTGEDSVESDKHGQDSPRGNSVVWSIVEAVPTMGALTSLQLSDADLSPDNIAAIGIAALDSLTLLMLNLQENRWDADAAKRFSEALEKNNVLIEVILPSRGGAQFRKKIQLRLEKNRQGSVEASAGMNDLVAVSSTSTTSTSTAPTASIWSGSTPSTAMTPAEKSTDNS